MKHETEMKEVTLSRVPAIPAECMFPRKSLFIFLLQCWGLNLGYHAC